ncbi:MAG TPA: sensor histidine kinase [Candidatus Dormibacteraeota bacterium]|nr:sensor histidine kinase [Candidatus Dormibacteraeota bacterium]
MSTPSGAPDSFVPSRFLTRQLYVIGIGAAVTLCTFIAWPPLTRWLLTRSFLPHAYCYLGNPRLVWTNVVADSLVAIAYLAISATLGYLGYKGRRDIPFHWMFLAFGLFILACGGTHFMEAVTIWIPVYILSSGVKLFTAAVSLTTAAVLPFTVPHAFELVRQARTSEKVTANLRASEERKEALLREVHHRVKNNLAVICSLFYLQSTYTKDEQTVDIFRDMESRVHSMALVHERLYGSENLARIDFAEYAQTLARDIFSSQGSVSVRLESELEPVIMGVDLAVPCGLILNELISNALKHGFPNRAGGEIRLTLQRGPDGGCTLRVEDSGVGIPADLDLNTNKSLGLRLVRSLTQQIRGRFELVKSNPGTSAHLQFRADRHAG